jgi:hypothetical protein
MRALASHPAAWSALGILLLLSFGIDLSNVAQGGAIDLRNRVTGTRLLLNHLDPYFYKWHEPEPSEYCDPYNNPHLPVSKTTATPAFLILNLPVAVLPYRLGEFGWFFVQWLCLLGTGLLWLRCMEGAWPRLLFGAFLTGFTYTAAWRLHAERGQAYVLLLFLFALWLILSLRTGRAFWAGLLAGFLIAFRPTFLLLVPFLALHRRGQLLGAGVGLVMGIVLPLFGRGDCWMSYASAMEMHSALYRAGIDPAPGPEHFPAEIEGMSTDLLANYAAIPYADFSVHALLRGWGLEPFSARVPLLIFLALFGAWLVWTRHRLPLQLLLGLAVSIFLADLFLPAYRDSYNDVLILNVVALGLLAVARFSWPLGLCFIALPAGWAILYFAPPHDWLIDLPSFFLTLGAAGLLFWFNFAPGPRKV